MNHLNGWRLENSYANLPEHFFTHINPTPVSEPKLLLFNTDLAKSLGIDLPTNDKDMLAQIFSGNTLPKNVSPIAQAYAGHQFGHFSILGDGRAHLIGEQITPDDERFDIQLKGSGPTPYSRNGDGRAALAPMLREYLISEAMHALNIPTTRSLALVSTGESIMRASLLDGAILTRVASSHLRVGTFEYAKANKGIEGLKPLADYAIARHYPELTNQENPYLDFLKAVINRQAKLVAAWMHIGFIHGVMNTDNMTISGETIDYGPCAFMDIFSMEAVFSSIDSHGRYKFGSQAHAAHWNLVRLADSLLPLLHQDSEKAVKLAEAAIESYSASFNQAWIKGMRCKLGLFGEEVDDFALAQNLLDWMQTSQVDYTRTFRDLTQENIQENNIYNSPVFQKWYTQWRARLKRNPKPLNSSFCLMRNSNPVIIPNNYYVEEVLAAAEGGDLKPFIAFLDALKSPFEETLSNKIYRNPTIKPNPSYQTFCGT
ncbi:YdiU family protein [Methylophilaceae bacterium]|nr:YdiU family protein [Methylophilaceae bacterium]